MPVSSGSRRLTAMVASDVRPPTVQDYGGVTGWSSLVVHCNDAAKTRILCVKLRKSSSPCVSTSLPVPSNPTSSKYSVAFCPSTAAGVTGSFTADALPNNFAHTLDLDFTNYQGTCDISLGVSYHLHALWANDTANSSSSCGASATGGHYDPTLACAAPSQYIDTLCSSISRTVASGYTYRCNASGYSGGAYGSCEVGDLSGKFGLAMPVSSGSRRLTAMVASDVRPPTVQDYGGVTGWSSLVVHCNDAAKTRILCGRVVEGPLRSCPTTTSPPSTPVSSTQSPSSTPSSSITPAPSTSTSPTTIPPTNPPPTDATVTTLSPTVTPSGIPNTTTSPTPVPTVITTPAPLSTVTLSVVIASDVNTFNSTVFKSWIAA
eukprot:PhF_6_TR19020/c3_g1_i2/m.27896